MSNTPRVALLGCGYWGKNLARNLHALGALACVCDPSELGRAKAIEIAGDIKITSEFESVFADASIDAVAIATPAPTHYELAVAALRAGKDVFVEKPMTLRTAEAVQLQSHAAHYERVLMVGHLMEYHPAIQKISQLAMDGELGDLHYIVSNRLNFGIVRTVENAWWSLAPHDVSVVLRLMGSLPESITCCGGDFITRGVDDLANAVLRFANGRQAQISVSWLHPAKERRLFVVGSRRSAIFDDAMNALTLYEQRVVVNEGVPELMNEGAKPMVLSEDEPLLRECQHFLDCVETRTTPMTDGASGAAVVRVLEAGQRSLEGGGNVIKINEQ
ncbi:MAG TPA: oxidoreductase [Verrucomicrobiales bacterium]|nr:oxidoreductase [Verrucomicrobiales bacterium]|tara:strand:+ start:2410 stop:3402 length:993 start_codon:yes stop_codon:yes gene_type:complete